MRKSELEKLLDVFGNAVLEEIDRWRGIEVAARDLLRHCKWAEDCDCHTCKRFVALRKAIESQ